LKLIHIQVLVFSAILFGCSSHDELPPPNNPFDPGNPDYVRPAVEIINGPGESEIVEVTTVTFEWQGNESSTEYSYQFDGAGWSIWSENTAEVFDYLDDGDHLFELQARSVNGDEQEAPTSLSFGVDAVEGLSVVLFPYAQTGSVGDTLVYQIIVEKVVDLAAIEYDIIFDAEFFEMIDVIDGGILDEWGGTPLVITEMTDSSVSMSMVSVESDTNTFSGSTTIVTLLFRVLPEAFMNTSSTVIDLNKVVFLTPTHDQIEIDIIRSGVFYEN
jgi:hypothetical protein